MEEMKLSYILLTLTEMMSKGPVKESDSDFYFTNNYHLISRRHEGDENGSTWCTFAEFDLPKEATDKHLDKVYVDNFREVRFERESSSEIICGDGEIIISRKHTGDENGRTVYKVGRVYVRVKDLGLLIPCVTRNRQQKTCKESSGDVMEIHGKSIVGRKHKGDENGQTTYTFANIAVPYLTE